MDGWRPLFPPPAAESSSLKWLLWMLPAPSSSRSSPGDPAATTDAADAPVPVPAAAAAAAAAASRGDVALGEASFDPPPSAGMAKARASKRPRRAGVVSTAA